MDQASRHVRALELALERRIALDGPAEEGGLAASWERCFTQHRLHPERVARPLVLSPAEIQDHSEPLADMLALSKGEVQRLHELLAQQDYVVMLTDAQGVVLSFRSNETVLAACSALDVLPGSIWSEERQGTNGIGLCLQEQRPLSIVMQDHFALSLTGVSCTVAPIFGAGGRLAGVLDITTLRPSDRAAQALARQLVVAAARRIENMYFERRNKGHALLRLSRHADFCDAATEVRIALDASGCILDATPAAQQVLAPGGGPILGLPVTQLQGLDTLARGAGMGDALLELEGGRYYMRLDEPRGRRPAAAPAPAAVPGDMPERPGVREIVGHDAQVLRSITVAQRLLAHRVPILLHGETGTGKSALARALHRDAGGADERFVAINCAAISPELIESELFGYRPGAFTGALRQGSRGRLLEADGGTLFLDEIGDMPLALQTRLLQVLSDGEFVPVGAAQAVRVRFALVAASLHDLAQQVRAGRFREDLYFRLAGATVHLPALREREDGDALVRAALAQAARQCGRGRVTLAPAAQRALMLHRWPGNLRELQHLARYAIAVDTDGCIDVDDLPPVGLADGAAGHAAGHAPGAAPDPLLQALERSGWNVARAAASLGISRATMHRRMRARGIARPAGRD